MESRWFLVKKKIIIPVIVLGVVAVAGICALVFGFGNKAENVMGKEHETHLLTDRHEVESEISVDDYKENVTDATETASTDYDYSSFGKTAFLGNSRFISFRNYNLVPNVYPVVGLDVRTAFTKHVDDSDVAVIDELDVGNYDTVVLMFGDNECGWPNRDYFVQKYAAVIDAVRTKQPDAKIYLHAIIPISAEASARNESGCNNGTIGELNARIEKLAADYGVGYIDVPACLIDFQGNLIDKASSDGVHLNITYSKVWLSYLEKVLF